MFKSMMQPKIQEYINELLCHTASIEYDLMKYKLANDALNIALWDMVVVDADPFDPENELIWSLELRNMLGFSDESDFPNGLKSWIDRLHPEDRKMTLDAFAAHINDRTGKTPYDIEYRIMLKNGYYRSFHAFGATLRDSAGIPLRVAGAMIDITEKAQMSINMKHRDLMLNVGTRAAELLLSTEDEAGIEIALTTSIELVGTSADVDRVNIWRNEMIDGELHFVLAYKWLSRLSRENTNMPVGLKFSYSDRLEWKDMFLRGECINGPISEMTTKDQAFLSQYDIKSIVMIPLFLRDRFWGCISLTDFRTERTFPEDEVNILRLVSLMIASAINRSAQAVRLREAHERTRLLLDAMPLVCHLWNRDFSIFDCNEENTRLFNLKNKNEIIGNFYKFSPEYQPDGRLTSEKAVECLQKAFDEGKYVIEWMHQLQDGTPIPSEVTLVRVPYEDDYVVAGYAHDLRQHKKMVDEIEQSKAQLEAANNAKSDFLASMSHEMRTPLNAVIGLSGLTLEMEGLNMEAKSNLEKVYNAGSTLLNIVNDILDISKIEAGKLELIPAEYDTPSLINDTITQNMLRIGEKPIEFLLDISPDIPVRLCGDELRVKQAITNLLSNAFKYTKEGFVELGIRSAPGEDQGTVRVKVWVKDTGIGIRPEDVKKLFSDYSQVDLKINRKIEGTGLGLVIAKKMLEAMGGTITVESEYGKGSVFTMEFQQKFVTNTPIGESVVENLKNFQYSDNMRNKGSRLTYVKMPYAKVLVVDDNITNLDVAKGLMKPYEMQIDCVTGGREAVDAIRMEKVKYDAVFMDHMMPEMDGIEALQCIRETGTDYAKNIPIIALTANAIAGNEEMFLSKGFQAFISKPINLMQLDSVLKRWVRNKSNECHEVHIEPALFELPEIPGVDVQKAMELYSGMMDIYLPVLRSYAENTPAVLAKLRIVAATDLPDYAVGVHGLKGASASICAEDIRKRSFELEMMANAGDLIGVLELNEALLRDTEALVDRIKAWLKKHDAKAEKPRLGAPNPEVLNGLRQSLINFDMNGIDDAMNILKSADYDTNADLIPWLEERITISEFDNAAKRIADMPGAVS